MILSVFFASGLLYAFIRHEPLPEIKLPPGKVTITGTVADLPEASERNIRFTLKDLYLDGDGITGKVRIYLFQKDEERKDFHIFTGDRVSMVAKLKEPNIFRNPGVYSYDIRKEGIIAIGFTRQVEILKRGEGILAWIGMTRHDQGNIMDNSLSPERASFVKAIITGLKRGIPRDLRDSFSSTGLAHLLSISGTHFGLLAFIVFQFIKRILKLLPGRIFAGMTLYITPTQIAVIATMPVLCLYVLISGASTPTIRSFIMVSIYMTALLLGRRGQWLNSLSIAAVIILLWQPDALFGLSFQLSFMAVLSIGYVLEKKTEKNSGDRIQNSAKKGAIRFYSQEILEKLRTSLLITVAAVMGTAPIIALYFKQFPLISPLTNLIITPLVCFIILPLGFLSGAVSFLFDLNALPLSGLLNNATGLAIDLTGLFSGIPYSNFHIPNPSFVLILLYYLSWFFIFSRKAIWKYIPLLLVIAYYLAAPYLSHDRFRVTFLDVGQGESSVVELPGGKVMLIDGGPSSRDTGRRVVAPYLWSKGITEIDYMVMSHPHPDHYGGLLYIVENFKIGEIWTNGRRSYGSRELFNNMESRKIPVKNLKRGDIIDLDDLRLHVLHPYDGFYADSPRGDFSNENSESLVMKIESDDGSILFTGDLEMEAEKEMVKDSISLKSDIIKVPHHGGKTSSSAVFLKAVSPETAVVSVGRNNPYYHPHGSAVKRYRDAGVRFLRTDMEGAVTIEFESGDHSIETYEDSIFIKVDKRQDELRNLKLLF